MRSILILGDSRLTEDEMTEIEMQALSRETAGRLPDEINLPLIKAMNTEPTGGIYLGRTIWLHESNEACAEIMVRVLWPAGWDLDGCAAIIPGDMIAVLKGRGKQFYVDLGDDPMLAFRIAVLRAVCAMGE